MGQPDPGLPPSRGAIRQAASLSAAGLAYHGAGRLADAERLYRDALALRADEPDALHGLGVLFLAAGRSGLAIALIGRAVRVRPDAATYHVNLAHALRDQGHVEEARAAARVAVLRDPDDPRGHLALALALEALKRGPEAIAAAADAVRHDPAHGTSATTVPGASALLGRLHLHAGEADPALRFLRAAAAETPGSAAAAHALAAALGALGRTNEAAVAFERVVALAPDDPAAWANLGGALFELNRLDEALAALRCAVAAGPASAATRSNLALVLMALGRLPEAERELAQAAATAPEADGILINRGSILADLGRHDEAEHCLLVVEARTDPRSIDHARARFNRATVLLATGRHAEGWAAFEARRVLVPPPPTALPEWDGQPLPDNGAVLLHAEQGLGDAIQFLRYVTQAAFRAPVHLALPDALLRLADCLRSPRCTLAGPSDPVPLDCVAQASLLSLPHLLRLGSVPPAVPYLAARKDAPTLVTDGRLAVGLCWAGNPGYRHDRRRSLRLEQLAPLADVPGIALVSLQAGAAAAQPAPPGLNLVRPPPPRDLADTAAVIAGLDLVISVDTAIAHLSGALGRPTWLLNRSGGDWRWQGDWQDGIGHSLWYPALRQFRQSTVLPPEQAWPPVIATLVEALARRGGPVRRRPP